MIEATLSLQVQQSDIYVFIFRHLEICLPIPNPNEIVNFFILAKSIKIVTERSNLS